jgi:hypothetical protein
VIVIVVIVVIISVIIAIIVVVISAARAGVAAAVSRISASPSTGISIVVGQSIAVQGNDSQQQHEEVSAIDHRFSSYSVLEIHELLQSSNRWAD